MGQLDQDMAAELVRIGGALDAGLASDSLLQLMIDASVAVRNEGEEQEAHPGLPAFGFIEVLPPELFEAAADAMAGAGWQQLTPGVEVLPLHVPTSAILAAGGAALIMRFRPGSQGLPWRQDCRSCNLVLIGGARTPGQTLRRGEFFHWEEGEAPAWIEAGDEGCVLLALYAPSGCDKELPALQ